MFSRRCVLLPLSVRARPACWLLRNVAPMVGAHSPRRSGYTTARARTSAHHDSHARRLRRRFAPTRAVRPSRPPRGAAQPRVATPRQRSSTGPAPEATPAHHGSPAGRLVLEILPSRAGARDAHVFSGASMHGCMLETCLCFLCRSALPAHHTSTNDPHAPRPPARHRGAAHPGQRRRVCLLETPAPSYFRASASRRPLGSGGEVD